MWKDCTEEFRKLREAVKKQDKTNRYGYTAYPLREEGKSCKKKSVGFLTKLWKGV